MNRKKGDGKRLVSTMLILALLVFTVWIVAVPAGANSASVTRELPDYVKQNEKFDVTLNQSGFSFESGIVTEVLPEGFEYVYGSYTGGGDVDWNSTTRNLTMDFIYELSVAYSVKASSYVQTAEFLGTYITFNPDFPDGKERGPIGGNTTVIVKDETPPASITNLQYTNGSTWIMWTWTNPPDADFSHVMVYPNDLWRINTSYEFYNARGLNSDTEYEIGTRTVDNAGNINATWVNGTARTMKKIFDTGSGTSPSISGIHKGTIKPNVTIDVSSLYTYPCPGTGGHTEYARIWNNTGLDATATWEGYVGGWHTIAFNPPFTLIANETYNYTIRTGSYPQIHHEFSLVTANGWINCTEFIDINGNVHYDWIPAIKLFW